MKNNVLLAYVSSVLHWPFAITVCFYLMSGMQDESYGSVFHLQVEMHFLNCAVNFLYGPFGYYQLRSRSVAQKQRLVERCTWTWDIEASMISRSYPHLRRGECVVMACVFAGSCCCFASRTASSRLRKKYCASVSARFAKYIAIYVI